jgi:hypothetical protein
MNRSISAFDELLTVKILFAAFAAKGIERRKDRKSPAENHSGPM